MYNLFYPMMSIFVLTQVVLTISFFVRLHAIHSKQMDPRYFKTFDFGQPTVLVKKTTRHFSNLFELPVLYYVGCLVAMHFNLVDSCLWYCSWIFVFARIIHAFIHIGPNKIYPRLASYLLGFFSLNIFWFHLFFKIIEKS